MLKIIKKIITKIKFKGYKFFYYKDQKNNFCNTAVKSKFGFWYTGNIFDQADISYGILNNGLVESSETNLVLEILNNIKDVKNNLTVFDIGANSGYYGILSAYVFKNIDIKVFSFEPIKEYFDLLNETVKINNLGENIKSFNFALSDKNDSVEISLSGSGSSVEKNFNGNIHLNKRIIETRKIDDLYNKNEILIPDFIKIDVEGHEYNVLEGGHSFIKNNSPVIFVEIAKHINNRKFTNEKYLKTIDLINSFGYKIFILKGQNLELFNINNDYDGVFMYLCLHSKKHNYIIDKIDYEKNY